MRSLKPPVNGVINVAAIVSDNTALIDLAGPWEVFGDTMLSPQGGPWRGGDDMIMPFNLYTVSDSQKPISAAGLQVIPNYTFDNAPKPQVIRRFPHRVAEAKRKRNGYWQTRRPRT